MKNIKEWIQKKICKLLKSKISNFLKTGIGIDDNYKYDEYSFRGLVGHRIELRHYSQEDSIFIDVDAVMENSTYIKDKNTNESICKSKGVIIIDANKNIYTLSNVYEYEIRKREVLYKCKT